MKNRIRALDWARLQALRQLKQVVEDEKGNYPFVWDWRVGRLTPNSPDVVVSCTTETGLHSIVVINLMKTPAGMQDGVRLLGQSMLGQLEALAKRKRKA